MYVISFNQNSSVCMQLIHGLIRQMLMFPYKKKHEENPMKHETLVGFFRGDSPFFHSAKKNTQIP